MDIIRFHQSIFDEWLNEISNMNKKMMIMGDT